MEVRPKILFVCIGNSCRSQIAEGFARALSGGRLEVFSAGSRPSGNVSPDAVLVMKESGIDISRHHSKGLSHLPPEKFDAIVTMGCGDACPQIPSKQRYDWQIPDPIGQPIDTFRQVRDVIRVKVENLIKEVR